MAWAAWPSIVAIEPGCVAGGRRLLAADRQARSSAYPAAVRLEHDQAPTGRALLTKVQQVRGVQGVTVARGTASELQDYAIDALRVKARCGGTCSPVVELK